MTLTGTYDIDEASWSRIIRLATRDKRVKEVEYLADVRLLQTRVYLCLKNGCTFLARSASQIES